MRGSTGNAGFVIIQTELFELAVSGNPDVITSGIAYRGPREVVVREIALENLTILECAQLSRSARQLVRLDKNNRAWCSERSRAEVTVIPLDLNGRFGARANPIAFLDEHVVHDFDPFSVPVLDRAASDLVTATELRDRSRDQALVSGSWSVSASG